MYVAAAPVNVTPEMEMFRAGARGEPLMLIKQGSSDASNVHSRGGGVPALAL
jgi:hypothetical protein